MLRITQLVLIGLSFVLPAACVEQSPGDWSARIEAENARIQDADPEFHDRVLHLQPQRTRNGWLRFTDPLIHHPDAAPILLQRLTSTSGDTPLRAALAEALPRTGGDFATAAVGLLAVEEDEVVRSVLVGTMRRAPPEQAIVGLRAGLADASPQVRAEAARTAGRRADGAALGPGLLAALDDEDETARAAAARAVSALAIERAVEGGAPH